MWLYQCLDIIATLTEAFALYLFSVCLCKNPRYTAFANKWIIIGGFFLIVYAMTWFTELGAYKMPFLFVSGVVLLKLCYSDSFILCIVSYEFFMIPTSILSEEIGMLMSYFIYHDNMLVVIDGNSLLRWEIYIIIFTVRIFTIYIVYSLCRNFCYQILWSDFLIITVTYLAAFLSTMSSTYEHINLSRVGDTLDYIFRVIIPGCFILVFLYVRNTLYLREQEQRDKLQIAQLQQQYAYYQEKQKDEERIRSIYHDMKNHLLVLEGSQGTDATRQMAQKLRSQIADYENYIHTGNDFLDIIIKDKAEKAREKQIDFAATIDFGSVDFIEPLDISTLFGNGIDNAIEASEKLPENERVILIKAGRVRDFVSVLIENNCTAAADSVSGGQRTSKADKFLHGFGISNMQKAAEKYGGACTAVQTDGRFTLKILLPVFDKNN